MKLVYLYYGDPDTGKMTTLYHICMGQVLCSRERVQSYCVRHSGLRLKGWAHIMHSSCYIFIVPAWGPIISDDSMSGCFYDDENPCLLPCWLALHPWRSILQCLSLSFVAFTGFPNQLPCWKHTRQGWLPCIIRLQDPWPTTCTTWHSCCLKCSEM